MVRNRDGMAAASGFFETADLEIQITNEMVRRAHRALENYDGTSGSVRDILDAALNQPPEPEFVITPEMKEAGSVALNNVRGGDVVEPIYRAMRKLEPRGSIDIGESDVVEVRRLAAKEGK